MINTFSVGPPIGGVPDLKSPEGVPKAELQEKTQSFAQAMSQKMAGKDPSSKISRETTKVAGENREVGRTDNPERKIEAPDGETKEKAATLEIPTKKSQLAKEKEIQKFMDSFESEFGIPPTRIVEAMAQLKSENISRSPEEMVEALVQRLKVQPEDEDKARELSLSFVINMQTIDRSATAPLLVSQNPESVLNPQIQERFLSRQEKAKVLNGSLERLNQKFWMKSADVPVVAQAAPLEISPEKNFKALTVGDLLNEDNLDENPSMSGLTSTSALENTFADREGEGGFEGIQGLEGSEKQPVTSKDLQKFLQEMKSNQNAASLRSSQGIENGKLSTDSVVNTKDIQNQKMMSSEEIQSSAKEKTSAPGLMVASQGLQPKEASPSKEVVSAKSNFKANDFFPSPNSPSAVNSLSSSAKGSRDQTNGDSSKDSGQSLDGKKDGDLTLGLATAGAGEKFLVKPGAAPELAQGAAMLNRQERQENIQQIMNQAQYLVKKGGGEVRVKMNPEGLGEIHLKVMVENGKVNLQMSAETAEAKKAVESSLSDLKNSLSAHRLSVDHVKIDVVGGANTDNSTQRDSTNLNSQSQRDTRQFWNQFQESFGNRGQRENNFEIPNLRSYGQSQKDPMKPVETNSSKAKRADGRGKGIDLVA